MHHIASETSAGAYSSLPQPLERRDRLIRASEESAVVALSFSRVREVCRPASALSQFGINTVSTTWMTPFD